MENMEQVLQSFIRTKRSGNTKARYEMYLKEFFDYAKVNNLRDFKNVNVDTYYSYKNFLIEKGIAENTIRLKLCAISSFYNFLIKRENFGITNNVVKNSDLFETTKKIVNPKHTTWLTKEESKSLLKECKDTRELAICAIFLNTGIRASELINLKLNDFNTFAENGKNVSTISIVRKGGKIQEIYFNEFVTECVTNYIDKRKKSKLNLLFVSNTGNKMSLQSIDRTIKKLKNKAGISRPISAHSLRRTAATSMYNQGFTIDEVQSVLGHSSPVTTQIYLKGIQNKSENVFRKFSIDV